ncbi:hypothetical protein HJFPF1_10355 [Paramyrothecium foliicola]|nr:hypothetical protein HJFPF1_10355 [Paramyrothecium foliicola]
MPNDRPPPYQDASPKTSQNFLDCGLAGCPSGQRLTWTPFNDLRPRWLLVQVHVSSDKLWTATLHVVAKDLPGLMKNGFSWGERNVDRHQCFIIDGTGWLQHHRKVNPRDYRTRCYTLSDTNPDERWVGFLEVCAAKGPAVGNFRIRDLSPNQIVWAHGRNPQNEDVYLYDSGFPDLGYNTICEDMPLLGWWPRHGRGDRCRSTSQKQG